MSSRERMLAGLPGNERRLRLAGAATDLIEAGGGPTLLLLNGGIECGAAYWAPVFAALAEGRRVIAPDLPGLGESEPIDDLTEGGFDRWLEALFDEIGSERPALVAHSLTAALATGFAARHPGALRRLLVYASPCIGPYRMPLRLNAVAIRFALRPTERNMERFQRFALLDRERTRDRDRAWFDAFTAYTASRGADRGVKRTMRRLVKAGAKRIPDEELRRIDAPTTLLWGREDRMTPLPLAEGARSRLGWPLHVIEGSAHVPHMEAPDAFVEAVTAWDRAE